MQLYSTRNLLQTLAFLPQAGEKRSLPVQDHHGDPVPLRLQPPHRGGHARVRPHGDPEVCRPPRQGFQLPCQEKKSECQAVSQTTEQ